MKAPLIILGAGASFDLIAPQSRRHDFSTIIPVTDDLAENSYRNDEIAVRYHEVNTLFSLIGSAIKKNVLGKTFEEQMKSITNPRQIMALKYYLSHYFRDRSHLFRRHPINHYRALAGHIEKNVGAAHIISFNYDTVLDHILGFSTTADYIKGPIKLYKVHGSSEWYYLVDRKRSSLDRPTLEDSFETGKEHFEYKTDHIYTTSDINSFSSEECKRHDIIPAIAIPIAQNKSFVCPDNHTKILSAALPSIEKILVIGWKAKDEYLIKLMQKSMSGPIKLTIVSGKKDLKNGKDDAKEIEGIFRSSLPKVDFKEIKIIREFTNFINNHCFNFFDEE